MLERGLMCILIGAAVLLAPIGGAYVVGWFALVLGVALVAVDLLQRAKKSGGR